MEDAAECDGARVADIDPQRRPGAASGRAAALAIAILAHVAILAALALGVQPQRAPRPPPITDVTIFPLAPRPALAPSTSPKAASPRRPGRQGETTLVSRTPALLAPAAGQGPTPASGTTDLARLGAALRASGVGCGLEGARLTAAEREACHERLGAGAADAAYITAVPPEKRAYYAALQASEAKLAHDRLGGHAPGFVCGKGAETRGFKLGALPCAFSPSPSPWAPELDVRPP